MLGYPTHFGQMETLKLIASSGFPEKRIGYLGLSLLLDERQEVLMLVTNSLKNDLNSGNHYIVGLALGALGTIASAEMARDLAPEVERLLQSGNPYVRKKAALCARRILRKVPDMLESFIDLAAAMLLDRNQSVLLTGVTLMQDVCHTSTAAVAVLRDQVPQLCRILRALQAGGVSSEYTVGGVNNPFLQVQILRLLRTLGHGSAEASDAMSDALAAVAANTDGSQNAGNAVLYEAVQTIMAIESIGGLRVLAVNILGRFLSHRDNNMRYVALNTLTKVVAVDTQAVQRHRATIVSCVKDADNSIRKRALELILALVNEGNIKTLTKELLDYLNLCDAEFKPDLTAKVCQLVARFAPDKRWHVDSLAAVLVQAGAYATEDACRALILLVIATPDLHGYAARKFYAALTNSIDTAEPALITVAAWCVGEYADILTSTNPKLLQAEEPLSVSEADILSLFEQILVRPATPIVCREVTLTAIAKAAARLPHCAPQSKEMLDKYARSPQVEVQTRAVEFSRLFKFDAIRPQVMEHIPPVEDSGTYDASLGEEDGSSGGAAGVGMNGSANAAADLAALLGLDVGATTSTPVADSATTSGGGADALHDLLGNGGGLMELDDEPAIWAAPVEQSSVTTIRAYEKQDLAIDFSLSKAPDDALTTIIHATYTNTGPIPLKNFTFQAAVPKYMTIKLEPASGATLPAGGAGSVTQVMHVKNTMHGQKKLVMRLRLVFTREDQQMLEQGEVSNFPAAF
jgi:AP-1 complex subunit gamma-1